MSPESIAVTDRNGSQTYRELSRRSGALALALRESLGLERDDRVLLCIENCAEFLEVLFACWRAGLTVVPVNTRLHPKEVRFIIEDSGAKVCFASSSPYADLQAEVSHDSAVRIIDVHSETYRSLRRGALDLIVEVQPGDAAWIFYTSGTTGRPKGAVVSHQALMFMSLAYFADIGFIEPGDTQIHVAPLSHAAGLYSLPHIAKGGHQVIMETPFTPAEVFLEIERNHAVSMFVAPTMLLRLLNAAEARTADISNIKTIIYGGGPMHLADLQRAIAYFGPRLYQIYGQGESPMTITGLSMSQHQHFEDLHAADVLKSVGTARTGVEVKIMGPEDNELPLGEIGEIATRSLVMMSGYLGEVDSPIKNGWLFTGDLGSMDAEGNLTLHGRSKEVIISGGSNIYPREVEEVILQHEAVSECAVVGRSSDQWGEEVVAFIVPVPGAAVTAEELDTLCLSQIARFKRPKQYLFRKSLPTNHYGKVVKSELLRILEAEDS